MFIRQPVEAKALQVGDENQLNRIQHRGLAGAVVPSQIEAAIDFNDHMAKAVPVMQKDAGESERHQAGASPPASAGSG